MLGQLPTSPGNRVFQLSCCRCFQETNDVQLLKSKADIFSVAFSSPSRSIQIKVSLQEFHGPLLALIIVGVLVRVLK